MHATLKSALKATLLLIISCLVALEVFSAIATRLLDLPANLPNYKIPTFKPFWSDINPIWGVWHEPHSRYDHVRKCYQAVYTANTHGMRDRERAIRSYKKRIIVLGDSFTEGFGLKRQERWTDQLEEKTHIPHLNFGNAGIFGPTQYSLLYENLAKKFDHAGVIIGLFPGNDLLDDSIRFGQAAFGHRYRPYYVKKDGAYELVYFNKNEFGDAPERQKEKSLSRGIRQVFRNFTHSVNVVEYTVGLLRQWTGAKIHGRKFIFDYSGYVDYTEADWHRFSYVFSRIRKAAGTKPILIVVIPRPGDFLYLKQGKHFKLQRDLKSLVAQHPNSYMLDLLPLFAKAKDWKDHYQICDGHWTPLANIMAADEIRKHPFYDAFKSAGPYKNTTVTTP
jgi:lysophospholipase L1-like esterase